MNALLERFDPDQIVMLVAILLAAIVAIVMIVAITKFQFQYLADDTALKREKQQAEQTMRQKLFERAIAAGTSAEPLLASGLSDPEPSDDLNSELAKRFGMLDTEPDEIETTLAQALKLEPNQKKTIVAVMDRLLSEDASPLAILAAVRPLCAIPPSAPKHAAV